MRLKVSSAICLNLDQSKILSSGNGLIVLWMRRLTEIPRDGAVPYTERERTILREKSLASFVRLWFSSINQCH